MLGLLDIVVIVVVIVAIVVVFLSLQAALVLCVQAWRPTPLRKKRWSNRELGGLRPYNQETQVQHASLEAYAPKQ